uniref:Uncharacterized protein n=1 Tax=Zea mays TaxID=4577 RepID=B6SZX6_MAIZE|nr:hypothetical protein [Zea mays]
MAYMAQQLVARITMEVAPSKLPSTMARCEEPRHDRGGRRRRQGGSSHGVDKGAASPQCEPRRAGRRRRRRPCALRRQAGLLPRPHGQDRVPQDQDQSLSLSGHRERRG